MIDRIDKDVKTAMKSGDAVLRDALRLVLSSLRDAEKAAQRPLTDDEVQAVLRRELKRRREAAKAFHDAGHADRAAAEESEAALIEGYLPAQLPDEDLDTMLHTAAGTPAHSRSIAPDGCSAKASGPGCFSELVSA